MEAPSKPDLPWGVLALGITGLFLVLLVERAVRHEPVRNIELLEHVRPRGAVDDLSPVEWGGQLPGDPYRFLVILRDAEAGGEGELTRSGFLTTNSWEIPGPVKEGWGKVQIRVYVVDPGNMTVDFRKEALARTQETIAWER
jgi:hypothetical protein